MKRMRYQSLVTTVALSAAVGKTLLWTNQYTFRSS